MLAKIQQFLNPRPKPVPHKQSCQLRNLSHPSPRSIQGPLKSGTISPTALEKIYSRVPNTKTALPQRHLWPHPRRTRFADQSARQAFWERLRLNQARTSHQGNSFEMHSSGAVPLWRLSQPLKTACQRQMILPLTGKILIGGGMRSFSILSTSIEYWFVG